MASHMSYGDNNTTLSLHTWTLEPSEETFIQDSIKKLKIILVYGQNGKTISDENMNNRICKLAAGISLLRESVLRECVCY